MGLNIFYPKWLHCCSVLTMLTLTNEWYHSKIEIRDGENNDVHLASRTDTVSLWSLVFVCTSIKLQMTRSNWKNLFGWTPWEYPPNNAAGTGNNASDSERFVMSPDSLERSPCTSAYQLSAHHANKVALRVWERVWESTRGRERVRERSVRLAAGGRRLAGWSPLCFTNEQLIYMKQRVPAARATQRNPVGEEKGRKEWGAKEGKRGRERQMRDSQRRHTRRGGIMRRSWAEGKDGDHTLPSKATNG